MIIGHRFHEPSRHGLGSISSLKRWRVAVRENLQWNLDCLITLIFLGVVLILLLLYSVLIVVPTIMLKWVAHHLVPTSRPWR